MIEAGRTYRGEHGSTATVHSVEGGVVRFQMRVGPAVFTMTIAEFQAWAALAPEAAEAAGS